MPKKTLVTGTSVTVGAPSTPTKNKSRRRARKPAPAKRAVVKTGAVSITTPKGKETITISPVVTNRRNRKRNRAMYGKEHMTQFSQLAKHMPGNCYELMKSVVSPAETDAPCGWPDAEMSHSLVLNKHMHAIKISVPTGISGEWSAVVMQFPSPEIAAIVWYCQGSISSNLLMPWASGPGGGIWANRQVIYWADVGSTITYGTNEPKAYAVSGINAEQEVDIEMYGDFDPSTTKIFPTHTTNFPKQVAKYRCMGFSNTITPSVNATNNQGIIYSRHADSRVSLKNLTSDELVYNGATWDSTRAKVHGQNVCVDQLPPNLASMLQTDCFTGPLYEGSYTIGKISDDLNYIDALTGRGLLTLGQSGTYDDTPYSTFSEWGSVSCPPNSTNSHTSFYPVLISMDPAWQPTITIIQGAANDAVLQMKLIGHFEAVPVTNGAMTYMISKPPPKNVVFLEAVQAVSSLIPEGSPASANTFWDVIKQIGSELWSVVKGVLPGILLAAI